MRKKKTKTDEGIFDLLGTASVMGLHMVSGPLVGGGIGLLLDSYLIKSGHYAFGIGLVIGIFAGFRNVFVDSKYMERVQKKLDEDKKSGITHEDISESIDEEQEKVHISYSIFGTEKKISFEEKDEENSKDNTSKED